MYTSQVRHLIGATHPRFAGRWEWAITSEDGHPIESGLFDSEEEARAAGAAALSVCRKREHITYWLADFNRHEDGHDLSMGLAFAEIGKYGISVDELDAMIDAAKACQHADALRSNIEEWASLLAAMLDRLQDKACRL